jgi:hypothetical protein
MSAENDARTITARQYRLSLCWAKHGQSECGDDGMLQWGFRLLGVRRVVGKAPRLASASVGSEPSKEVCWWRMSLIGRLCAKRIILWKNGRADTRAVSNTARLETVEVRNRRGEMPTCWYPLKLAYLENNPLGKRYGQAVARRLGGTINKSLPVLSSE